jgi:hypothetical protein
MNLKPSDFVLGVVIAIVLAAATLVVTGYFSTSRYAVDLDPDMEARQRLLLRQLTPGPPRLEFSPYHSAPVEVARVFRRSQRCAEADPEFIDVVAQEALRARIDPRMVAATIVVESSCNQYAISSRGAVGYMQVMPRVWKNRYDIARRYNLFNDRDNLRVGATILSELVQTYGVWEGVRRYQGTGQDCRTCDAGYTTKILALAEHE